MNSFKFFQLAKTCLAGRQELPFHAPFLSFFLSVAMLCNSKMTSTGHKIANFRYNPKTLNEFSGRSIDFLKNNKLWLIFGQMK